MPELPEVRTVVSTLEKQIKGATILGCQVLYAKIIDNINQAAFSSAVINQKFEAFSSKGKYLIFTLTDYVLIVHLRMEGKFYFYHEKTEPIKHTHLVLDLDKGQLHYNDVRKFGRFYLYKKGEEILALKNVGYEPFDKACTASYLRNYCRNKKTAVKTMLLNQNMIAGIGNIYANEICHQCHLNPSTPSCYISQKKWDEVIQAAISILKQAIKDGGTTIRSYTSSLGITGRFQQHLQVHGKEHESCQQCHSSIEKCKVDQRGTYYCPNCQKTRAVVVAITGTIGSGKSQVMEYLKQQGYKCISCDAINKQLLTQTNVQSDLADILACSPSQIDKNYLASRIFTDEEVKDQVETYLHQKILVTILSWIESNSNDEFLFVEVPLLFEVNWDNYFDYNVTVKANNKDIITRLMKDRKMTQTQIEQRMKSQLDVNEKVQRSDYVISNDGDLSKLRANVGKFINYIVKLNMNCDGKIC